MRNLMLLAALFSPLALAQAVIEVAPHGVMRLPTTASTLHIERLRIAEHGTLLIPAIPVQLISTRLLGSPCDLINLLWIGAAKTTPPMA